MSRTEIIAVCCSLAVLTLCLPAGAAVFERDWLSPGDGLLTFDDINQREWLDLTETQLSKFPGDTVEDRFRAVLDETEPGGLFAGFTHATTDDVFALAESAGIDTSTQDYNTNRVASFGLIDLLGATSGTALGSGAEAIVADLNPGEVHLDIVVATGFRDRPNLAGVLIAQPSRDFGVWLSRPIPEPPAVLGSVAGLIGSTLVRSRYRSGQRARRVPLP